MARGPSLFRTTAARLTLLYLVLVMALLGALLVFAHWMSVGSLARQTDASIDGEVVSLRTAYRRGGLPALHRTVQRRAEGRHWRLYLLGNPGGPFAGNLDAWPAATARRDGWLDFTYALPVRPGEAVEHAARARVVLLPPDLRLLVGRDVQNQREVRQRLERALLGAGGAVLVLGFAGGALIARNAAARVGRINAAARKVMEGNLSHRLPARESGDEIDQLASTFNAMIARIEGLVKDLRSVTDNIAHDLRTPLTRLRTGLETALLGSGDADDRREALERAIGEADQLIRTFNALLGIARIESGAPPTMRPLDLAAIVREMAEIYAPVAEEAELALFVHAGAPLGGSGDRTLLAQAVANLLDNAIKYSPAGGSVRVTARGTRDGAEIVVADDGPGVPAADRSRVLDRFVRLGASRDLPGSGLGLSLVEAVVRLHGGALSLEDNAPGLKARMTFPVPGGAEVSGG